MVLGRHITTKWYTGTYGSGTLYATESYTHRYDGLISTITDPGNDTTTYEYDFLGRYTQILYPDSSSVSYSYDDTNNKITFTNGRGYDRMYWYDWLNRLTKVEEEYQSDQFAVTTHQYNDTGNLISSTDAETHSTNYEYATIFGLTKITYPDSTYEEYEYDNVGNIVSFTDANGNETTFTHDEAYRLTQIQYQDQSTVSFTYDLNGNRIKMEDDSPNTGDYVEYTHDYWNRLITKTRHISQDTYTISYQRDEVNRLTKLTYPDNMQILYSYDDLNRLIEIKRYVDGLNDEILLDDVQYDVESLLTQFDYGNDLQAFLTYDSKDRLVTLDVKNGETSFLDLDYTYDDNSNITQLINGWRDTGSEWNSETELYSYDGLDRITSASCTSWSHTYSYDKVGNITTKDGITFTINAVNEVTSLSDGTSFTYDDNGNRIQKTKGTDTWVYTYDYVNRLTKVEENSISVGEYTYDGDGRRLQVTEDSVATTYVYSGWNVLYEENSTGTTTYIYGLTGRLAKRNTIQSETYTYYYHTDHLGSTRIVTDDDKNIISAATYHPFGEVCAEEGSEDFLFNGKERDSIGLFYYGARFYDSEIGRFITRDTVRGVITNPRTMNKYAYCLNNPLKYIDPDGHQAQSRYKFEDPHAKELDRFWSELYFKLLAFKYLLVIPAKWNNFVDAHPALATVLEATTIGGIVASLLEVTGLAATIGSVGGPPGFALGAVSAFIGTCIALLINFLCKEAGKYWNDPEFSELYDSLLGYTSQMAEGYDVAQEWLDTLVELVVESYKIEYGENWRDHCPQEIQDYYDEMKKKENQSSDDTGGSSDSGTGDSGTGDSGGNSPQMGPKAGQEESII